MARNGIITEIENARICAMYHSDKMIPTEIARQLGRNVATIRKVLKRNGIFEAYRNQPPAEKFHGKPCAHCSGTERYVSSGKCVPCGNSRVRYGMKQSHNRAVYQSDRANGMMTDFLRRAM